MVIRSIFHFSHTPEQMLMGLLSPSLYFLSSCLYLLLLAYSCSRALFLLLSDSHLMLIMLLSFVQLSCMGLALSLASASSFVRKMSLSVPYHAVNYSGPRK